MLTVTREVRPVKYYEIHLTLDIMHKDTVEEICKQFGWKSSVLKGDPVMGDGILLYATTHVKSEENFAFVHMEAMVKTLADQGIPVLREKIEAVVHDVRPKNAQ